jgi:hypothetical protein
LKCEELLTRIITMLRADPAADVGEPAGELLTALIECDRLCAVVLFTQGTPIVQLERADLAEAEAALGPMPGIKVERWPQGYIAPNRPPGAKPIVMQLTVLNTAERAEAGK